MLFHSQCFQPLHSMSQHHGPHSHSHGSGACSCSSSPAAVATSQSLDEMSFERGLWGAALAGDVEKAADPNEQDQSGYTPLHYAARAGKVEVCRTLLSKGANPNCLTRAGAATPLHRAAFIGNLEIVKLLLKNGANPNIQDDDGSTPLHKSVAQSQDVVARTLIEAGANTALRDKHGKTAADLIQTGSQLSVILNSRQS